MCVCVCVCVCVLCCFVLCCRNSSAVSRGFCLLFATCNSNAWKALSHHQTHTLTQSAELNSKGSNYITQPNNELIIEDGGHLAFDQGLRDSLWEGEGGGGIKESSLSFPNQLLPLLQWIHLHCFGQTWFPITSRSPVHLWKRLPVFNIWRNTICMELYALSRSSTMFPRTIIREWSSKSFIFHFILPSVDPKNKFRERGSSSQESGYQRFDSFRFHGSPSSGNFDHCP